MGGEHPSLPIKGNRAPGNAKKGQERETRKEKRKTTAVRGKPEMESPSLNYGRGRAGVLYHHGLGGGEFREGGVRGNQG